jgi:cyclophilin family peptidyl-prolyl cis-trans isomerase
MWITGALALGVLAGNVQVAPAAVVKKSTTTKSTTRKAVTMTSTEPQVAVLETAQGTIVIRFHDADAPKTTANFKKLVAEHFYDGTYFHRVIPGFMIQGGDPTGTGSGGPGYKFRDEPVSRSYNRGILAMANAGPNTNGSQFFVMHADYRLPPNYTIFGRLTAGEETLDAIASAPTGAQDRPVNPVTINHVEIAEE